MAANTLYKLNSDLVVTFKTADCEALSFSVHMKSFVKVLSFVLFSFFVLGIGTLLFFRELETSRKLEDRLLQVEIRNLLTKAPPVEPKTVEPAPPIPAVVKKVAQVPTEQAPTETLVSPRIQEFITDCQEGICNVQLSLSPSQTGIAQGELLVVLEAEIPRIGTTNTSGNIRKRFFIYPGLESKDELSDEQISALSRKPFRFARALQTSVEFNIGEVLTPIATNLYVYDSHGTLIQHERKPIEMGVPNAQ